MEASFFGGGGGPYFCWSTRGDLDNYLKDKELTKSAALYAVPKDFDPLNYTVLQRSVFNSVKFYLKEPLLSCFKELLICGIVKLELSHKCMT